MTKVYHNLKMAECESVVSHIHSFWSILAQLQATGGQGSNEDSAIMLLASLPDSYQGMVMSLNGLSIPITLQIAINMILQKETRKKMGQKSVSSTENTVALYT